MRLKINKIVTYTASISVQNETYEGLKSPAEVPISLTLNRVRRISKENNTLGYWNWLQPLQPTQLHLAGYIGKASTF
jgi:hypothetical protein